MSCCTTRGTDRFFSRSARHYARKFRKHGLDAPQQKLADGLAGLGIQGASLIEIGCGVGGLHLSLLKRGASTTQGVELSEGMLMQAKALAEELGVRERVTYLEGDFAEMCEDMALADAVIMDKVLCCYADPVQLIQRSAAKSRKFLAVSYPRKGILARTSFSMAQAVGKILRWSFHPFYHATDLLESSIGKEGFAEVHSSTTPIWQVKIYRRGRSANAERDGKSSPVFASAPSGSIHF
ncbi:MAG: class I SAM-dependent methyltransferase [Ignavibacteria bacterium]|nr:class I SAM-dependent methyltransferase [Ignavibacteria bacterium]